MISLGLNEDVGLLSQFASGIRSALSAHEPRRENFSSLSLIDWSKRMLPAHCHKPFSPLHHWIGGACDVARDKRGKRIVLIGPREGAKSTLGSLANVLRCAVEGSEPLIWVISETASQAAESLENLKLEIENNPSLRANYPHGAKKGGIWSANKVRLANGVKIAAFGAGQKLRGRKSGKDRPTLIICDDLQGDQAGLSARIRERDERWFLGTVTKAGTKATNIIVLANAIHADSLGMKLARTPGWLAKIFPAIESWPERMDLWQQWALLYHDLSDSEHARASAFYADHQADMERGAKVLWPENESLLELMKQRETEGHVPFEREKQCRPVNQDMCEWPESYFEGPNVWFDEWPRPEAHACRVLAIDPSKGADSRRGDYSAIVSLCLAGGVLYVDADLRQGRPVDDIAIDAARIGADFRPQAVALEENGFQALMRGPLVAAFEKAGLLGVWVYPLQNTERKIVRIRTLTGLLSTRRIRFKSGSPGVQTLLGQMKDFPDPASHDDGPDALEMAVRVAASVLHGGKADSLGARKTLV